MPSVLHLLGSSADAQTNRLHAALVDRLGPEFQSETRTIGHGCDHRQPVAAAVALRRASVDLVVAWGLPALAAAAMGRPSAKVIFAPDSHLGPKRLRWARTLLEQCGGTMICPTDAQHQLAVRRGVSPDRCVVIRPGADFGRVRQSRGARQSLRAQLGFAESDYVLFAPGESTFDAGHERVVWMCGILHILDPSYRLVIQGSGRRTAGALRLAGKLKQSAMMADARATLRRPVATEELLAVADACLLAPAGVVPTLPIVSAMAAGVPFVTVATHVMSELLEDRHTALMVATDAPKALARRVMDLRADPTLAAKLADTARAEAYELHTQAKMLDRYRRVFKQTLAGREIDPDLD